MVSLFTFFRLSLLWLPSQASKEELKKKRMSVVQYKLGLDPLADTRSASAGAEEASYWINGVMLGDVGPHPAYATRRDMPTVDGFSEKTHNNRDCRSWFVHLGFVRHPQGGNAYRHYSLRH